MNPKYIKSLIDRFVSYVKIDTQSDDESVNCPSTKKQFDLAYKIKEELLELGLVNVVLTDKCYLSATLPANAVNPAPALGFISHMDTSPDVSGKNVIPQICQNYSGNDIVLDKSNKIILSPNEFPILKKYIGQDIITTSGNTLLGADNKAGIAEIITAISIIKENNDIQHSDIHICFTPDEEIGRGTDFFDVQAFGAKYAYTVDSGEIGGLEYETFNAATAYVTIKGKNVHPGTAKGIMINSQLLAMEFNSMLPSHERPEHTSGYEGFYHLIKTEGSVEKSTLQYIVRDHNKYTFQNKKRELQRITDFINSKYNHNLITLNIKDSYYNMREMIEKDMTVVDRAKKAFEEAGINPRIEPIRGGTDGARLSFMGLPTPNIFTGGHNFHSKFEFIPVQSMVKAVEVIVNIIKG